jgi:hypothetical protein
MDSSVLREKRFVARAALIVVSVVLVGYAAYAAFSSRTPDFPPTFIAAWQEAARVSADIVRLAGDTNNTIQSVNALDLQGDRAQALSLIGEARASNQQAYGKAIELTQALQNLTESLHDIPSQADQQAGYQAAATELSLVSEFIVYTENLNRFLDGVTRAVSSDAAVDRRAVEDMVNEVNVRVRRINDLNNTFLKIVGASSQPQGTAGGGK